MAPSATPPSLAVASVMMALAPEAPILVGGQQHVPGPGQIPLGLGTAGATDFVALAIPDGPGTSSPSIPVFYSQPGSQHPQTTARGPQIGAYRWW